MLLFLLNIASKLLIDEAMQGSIRDGTRDDELFLLTNVLARFVSSINRLLFQALNLKIVGLLANFLEEVARVRLLLLCAAENIPMSVLKRLNTIVYPLFTLIVEMSLYITSTSTMAFGMWQIFTLEPMLTLILVRLLTPSLAVISLASSTAPAI